MKPLFSRMLGALRLLDPIDEKRYLACRTHLHAARAGTFTSLTARFMLTLPASNRYGL